MLTDKVNKKVNDYSEDGEWKKSKLSFETSPHYRLECNRDNGGDGKREVKHSMYWPNKESKQMKPEISKGIHHILLQSRDKKEIISRVQAELYQKKKMNKSIMKFETVNLRTFRIEIELDIYPS